MKNYETLLVEIADYIAYITLNRPQSINALTFEMTVELGSCLEELRDRELLVL